MRVELPGGTSVEAFGLSGLIPVDRDEPPDWALYLDDQWRERSPEWPHRFVDWPDFGLPLDEGDAFDAITEAWNRARRGELVDIACDGGTGRTGTALACIAMLAGSPTPTRSAGFARTTTPGLLNLRSCRNRSSRVSLNGRGPHP